MTMTTALKMKNTTRFSYILRCCLFGLTVCASVQSTFATAAEYLPNIERREVVTPGIDSENFEISSFVSLISVQDFGVEPQFGLRLAYHIHEDFFVEGSIAQTDVGASSTERANNALAFDERRYTDYHLSTGWNFLHGYSTFGDRRVVHNTYLIGGAGITNFADQNNFTTHFGLGQRLLLNDTLAIRLEGKNYMVSYDSPLQGSTSTQHNIALSLGLSLFF